MDKEKNTSKQSELISSQTSNEPKTKETWVTTDTININFDPLDFSILVTERAPLPFRIAFCGGGAKIPAHIGALEELTKRKVQFTEFSGSSAGALIAAFAYLGYSCDEINEIISWFDDDKLLDNQLVLAFSNVKQIVQKGGLNSAKSLHQAANFVILKKVVNIISDEKYKHHICKTSGFLRKNVFDCPCA